MAIDMPQHLARATLIGPVAARAFGRARSGVVRAVFDRSLYLTIGEIWICAGPQSLGAGPLNMLCEPWGRDAASGIWPEKGDPAWLNADTLQIGRALTISLAAASEWRPRAPQDWNHRDLAHGLAAFRAALPHELPSEGLGRLMVDTAREPLPAVAAAAKPAADYLVDLVARVKTACSDMNIVEPARLAPLLGLGPGLTPSGDDFLGGAMIALALTGLASCRDVLWRALAPLAPSYTTDISRAHLAAAAEGLGNAALHTLLAAIMAGRPGAMREQIAAVAAIGHTSGWDALAGAIVVLRTACVARETNHALFAAPGLAQRRL
jgi:hypothetical protein